MGQDDKLPIIDVAALLDRSSGTAARRHCADAIGAACAAYGFFYVSNHGIPEATRHKLLTQAKSFFDLPVPLKMKLHLRESRQFRGYVPMCGEVTRNKKDWHECYDIQPLAERAATSAPPGGAHILDDPGQWPTTLPEFPGAVMQMWDRLSALAGRLVEGLALSLGLEESFFASFTSPQLCDLRLSHYPPFPVDASYADVDAGMGAHYDLGFLAVLTQDEMGGLEIMSTQGDWIDAPHIPGTYLINIGLMVQHWTNERYRATLHRVRLPKQSDRYSIPFFYEPKPDAVIAPLDVCCSADNPPRYEPCKFGEFLSRQFSAAYLEPAT